ncbi:hypothetical protein QPK87_31535 [Kamptonema cortianum]|nr:hypothetical protein [Geitlerinema splendidum]MDK3161057.1 hypothetical protein [Kamptonema cortianum]
MSKRISIISLAICGLAAIAVAQSTNRFLPKQGDTWAFRQKVTTEMAGTTIIYTSKMANRVLETSEKGFKVEITESEGMLDMGGGEEPQGDASTSTVMYGARGEVLTVDGQAMADNPVRFASLFNFIYPEAELAKGLKWEYSVKANKELGTYDTTYKYEVLEPATVNGVATFKVKFSMEEKATDLPGSNVGTVWLDAKTARPIKAESKFTNASIQGMAFSGSWELSPAN